MAENFKLVSYMRGVMRGFGDSREKWQADGVHVPMFLTANITECANHRSEDSYLMRMHRDAYENHSRDTYLNARQWDDVFREAERLGIRVIFIRGGEPLTRKCILERAARYPDILFPVFTNGSMLDEAYLDFFRQNRNVLPVLSQKGLGDLDVSQTGRGSGLYGQLLQTMEELERRGLLFGNAEKVTRQNYRRLLCAGYVNELKRRGSRVLIYLLSEEPGTAAEPFPEEELIEAEALLAALQRETQDMVLLMQPQPNTGAERNLFRREGVFAVDPQGVVHPAPYRLEGTKSVKDLPLREILKEDLYKIG